MTAEVNKISFKVKQNTLYVVWRQHCSLMNSLWKQINTKLEDGEIERRKTCHKMTILVLRGGVCTHSIVYGITIMCVVQFDWKKHKKCKHYYKGQFIVLQNTCYTLST